MRKHASLDALLDASARCSPMATALIEPFGQTISYHDLNTYAGVVSGALGAFGVGAGDRVGLCVRKSIGAVASIFAILKSGAAYVPVDVGAPPVRNGLILNDCGVKAVIVETARVAALLEQLEGEGWTQAPFPAYPTHPADFAILHRASEDREQPRAPMGLAYILYTSGSTGRPKGVMHSHATARSFVDWCSNELEPGADDCFSSHAPFHFDLSILDLYVPIKHGASVVLIDSEIGKQPGTLSQIIAERGITIWYSTPTILHMLIEYGKLDERSFDKLRTVIFAGEVFHLKHLKALTALWPRPTYYNFYGPTETNVCTVHKVEMPLLADRTAALPIGRACSDDRLRVVAADGADVPRGEEGELYVAGGSVMLGYWNLPARNAEAFHADAAGRWYKTGDIVREDGDGAYTFLCRRDRMVKRRGFRVELGEIEATLHRHASIGEAAVIAVTNGAGDTLIHAYLTWSDGAAFSIISLKQFVSQHLPLHMIPDRFSVLPALPKTTTDKIDYQRLKDLG